jgi:alanine dehydrogenase
VSIYSDEHAIEREIQDADMVIGAVLLRGGAAAPKRIKRKHLRSRRPGSGFGDVAIDQGGVSETSRATSHDNPVYMEEGVLHYCVANMPAAYSRTSTIALSNATIQYGLHIANRGVIEACRGNEALARGLAVFNGSLTVEPVAREFGMESVYADTDAVINR